MKRRSKTERSRLNSLRKLRTGDVRKVMRDRCGYRLPNDDSGRDYLFELLLPISLGPNAKIQMRNTIEYLADWMGKREAAELIDHINRMPPRERWPSNRELGERLNLPYGQRARLRVRTIAPCDVTDAGMKLLRKRKKRRDAKLRRQSRGGQSRAAYLASHTVNRTKPWLGLGISRATYYRRRETSPYPTSLTYSQSQTCLTERAARPPEVAEPGEREKTEIKALAPSKVRSTEEARRASDDATAGSARTYAMNGNGGLRARVCIKEIRPPAISACPDDNLDDFPIAARI